MRHVTTFQADNKQRRSFRALAALGVFMLLGAEVWAAGIISGTVKDSEGGVLPGVTVTLSAESLGEPLVTYADGEGSFLFDGLNPGVYTLRAELDGFQPSETTLTLVVDQRLTLEFKLALATLQETVEVTAEAPRSSEVALLDQRREAAVVSDAISREEIARTPDADAASVVERLTGITVVDSKYVYVRGLGDRYSNTMLNGAALPSTEADKRVVPLDLFPSKLLDTITIAKTYTPDKPGDFGAGAVEMSTLNFPTSASLKVSMGGSWDSQTTGNEFARYAGGLNWVGKGGQPKPAGLPAERIQPQSIINPNGLTPEQLQAVGRLFVGHWTGEETSSIGPNSNLSLTYGNTFGRLGIVVSGVTSRSFSRIESKHVYFGLDSGNVLVPRNDYEMVTDAEKVRNGLVGNFALRLADGHRVTFASLFSRDALAESRQYEGYMNNAGQNVRDLRARYQQEELFTNKLAGEHFFAGLGMGTSIDWFVSLSTATTRQDLRENLYGEISPGRYTLQPGLPESGKLEFFDLEDQIRGGGLSWSTFYSASETSYGSIKVGVSTNRREREFDARRLRFVVANQLQFDLSLPPEQLFTYDNIRPDGFEIREQTGANDAYDAYHDVDAGFAMLDASWGKWRFVGGARYEKSDLEVRTYNPFAPGQLAEARDLNRDWLPAVNVVYELRPDTNLRLAASRTVNRPEFRELSPFAFVEVTGGKSVAGNPELKQALIDAVDLRWEMFPAPGEVIAFSAFHKKLTNPIERIIQPTTELRSSFTNADGATLTGLEVEYRQSLAVLSPALQRWTVNLNYAFVDASVEVGERNLSVITNTSRPLEGQSEHVGNLAVQYFQPNWGTMVRVMYNFTGQRIHEVGAYGLPDIYEDDLGVLDLVLSQALDRVFPGVELKLSGTNLLDAERSFTQGGRIHRKYNSGRGLGISIGYTAF